MDLLVFGDQSSDTFHLLEQLLTHRHASIVDGFLNEVSSALRVESKKLPAHEYRCLPPFRTVADLIGHRCQSQLPNCLMQALTCVCHLVVFIDRYSRSDAVYPSEGPIVGIGIGTLAAAAVSYSRSVHDLVRLAVYVSVLSFRVGLLVSRTASKIEPTGSEQDQWSLKIALPPHEAETYLSSLCDAHHASIPLRPFVSARWPHHTVIAGPPTALQEMRTTLASVATDTLFLNVRGPYHCPQLYDSGVVQELLGPEVNNLQPGSCRSPVISASDGCLLASESFESSVCQAVADILIRPIDFGLLKQGLSFHIGRKLQMGLRVISIACPAQLEIDLQQSLTKDTLSLQSQRPTDFLCESSESVSTRDGVRRQQQNIYGKTKIAITGMSGRFPGANNISEFWDVLSQGLDMHTVVPASRWDVTTHVDPSCTTKNTSATPYGCWLSDAGMFDPAFFNLSPKQAPDIDPAQRLALLTTYEAMEQAGIVPDATPSTRRARIGVWYGIAGNDWMDVNSAQDIGPHLVPGGQRAFVPGRINYFFKFTGPSYSIDTACSSSLAAIHAACNAIWLRDVDTAIVGGANIITNHDLTAGLDRGHFLSRTGSCKTFDETADGYCRGESVATIVIKRLDDALEDRDPILGVINDVATNHNAEAQSITRPCVKAQKALFRQLIRDNGLKPSDITYAEMHGTGTQIGDVAEMQSVTESLAGSLALPERERNQPLWLGSAKPNVGHGEATAGITSLVKSLLMLQKDQIPPNCGIKTRINPKFPQDLHERNVQIATHLVEWKREIGSSRRILVNNFGAAGGNSALIVEDAPWREEPSTIDVRSSHVVTISAKTREALRRNIVALAQHTKSLSGPNDLSALSYTLTVRRCHHQYRVAVQGNDLANIREQLLVKSQEEVSPISPTRPQPLVMTFTGQGCDYAGMAKRLFESFSTFKYELESLDKFVRQSGYSTVMDFLLSDEQDLTKRENGDPITTHLSIVIFEIALFRLWRSWGVVPSIVLGHSLGQYAAFNSSGVLSDADTIRIVGERARLLKENCSTSGRRMVAVNGSPSKVEKALRDMTYEIACVNSPNDVVVGIDCRHCDQAKQALSTLGLRSTVLEVPYAIHTSQVEPILPGLEAVVSSIRYRKPLIPIACPTTQTIITDVESISSRYFVDHCRKAINVPAVLDLIVAEPSMSKSPMWLEIGPKGIVSRMMKANTRLAPKLLPTFEKSYDMWPITTVALSRLWEAGVEVKWSAYHHDYQAFHRVLSLPAYSWDLQEYWIQYRNDWSLHKGDPCDLLSKKVDAFDGINIAPATVTQSPMIQIVDRRESSRSTVSICSRTDLSHSKLHDVIHGHKVNGVPLCPPSLYVDIAYALGQDLLLLGGVKGIPLTSLSITNLEILKALIPLDSRQLFLVTEAYMERSTYAMNFSFSTLDENDIRLDEHAKCGLVLEDNSSFDRTDAEVFPLITEHIKRLRNDARDGTDTFRYSKTMLYRMVSDTAVFDHSYRGIDEWILSNSRLDACSFLEYSQTADNMAFAVYPPLVDSIVQSAGFAMNINDAANLREIVYVNHGWKSSRMYQRLLPGSKYETYVKMKKETKDLWLGDLFVLSDGNIVATFEGIQMQGVPRRVLTYILSNESKQITGGTIGGRSTSSSRNNPQKPPIPRTGLAASENYDRGVRPPQLRLSMTDHLNIAAPQPNCARDIPQALDQDNQHICQELILKARTIISAESGIPVPQLHGSKHFFEIGMDSLMSMMLVERFHKETGIDVPHHLILNGRIGDLEDFIVAMATATNDESEASSDALSGSSSRPSDANDDTSDDTDQAAFTVDIELIPDKKPSVSHECPQATAVVLQNASDPHCRTVFLIPDGAGTAASYITIPKVSPNVRVIGLNSPYSKNPEQMSSLPVSHLDCIVSSYIDEIRRWQSSGPYILGGWSAGGILAYRATQLLSQQGQEVDHLILIDSPAPISGLDLLPQSWYDHCLTSDFIGNVTTKACFTGNKVPESRRRLVTHLKATIDMLHSYTATPLSAPCNTKICLIWAQDAFLPACEVHRRFGGQENSDNPGLHFLMYGKDGTSPNGWEGLLSPANMTIVGVPEANHFSIMRGQPATSVARAVERALTSW